MLCTILHDIRSHDTELEPVKKTNMNLKLKCIFKIKGLSLRDTTRQLVYFFSLHSEPIIGPNPFPLGGNNQFCPDQNPLEEAVLRSEARQCFRCNTKPFFFWFDRQGSLEALTTVQ